MPSVAALRPRPACAGTGGRHLAGLGGRDHRNTHYSIGVGGKGLIPRRDMDSFGVGFYYLAVSDKLPRLIQPGTRDEQGVELYYNIALAPWFHVTPDLQIISPAGKSVNTTVVAGLRAKIDF